MNKSTFTRAVAFLLVFVLLFSLAPIGNEVSAAAYTGIMHQTNPVYKNYWYGSQTLYDLGCGIFALANAVGYLTGYRLDVIEVANWAYSQGVFDDVYGIRGDYFYSMASARYGPTYGFTIDSDYDSRGYYGSIYDTRIKNHLMNGGTVVVHVDNHFMSLVGYDRGTGLYHVYDSGPCTGRNTLSGNGDVWMTAAQLNSGYTNVDWYHLVSPVVADKERPVISNVKVSDVTSGGYTVSCTVTDNKGVQKVAFPTRTLLNGQDDLPANFMDTQQGIRNGNTYTFHVKASDHNNEEGYYVTHIYAKDSAGNEATLFLDPLELKETIELNAGTLYKLEKNLLVNVKVKTQVGIFLGQFKNQGLKVLDKSGNPRSNTDVLSTGDRVELYSNGKLTDTRTVVVTGDVNGDGVVDTTDYMRVKALFLGSLKLTDAQTRAADVDASGSVDATDYIRIKAHLLRTINLYS